MVIVSNIVPTTGSANVHCLVVDNIENLKASLWSLAQGKHECLSYISISIDRMESLVKKLLLTVLP